VVAAYEKYNSGKQGKMTSDPDALDDYERTHPKLVAKM